MTHQEIARALETLIREDAKRPPQEQIQDLIDAGVIDEQGRILIGSWNRNLPNMKNVQPNGPGNAPSSRRRRGRKR